MFPCVNKYFNIIYTYSAWENTICIRFNSVVIFLLHITYYKYGIGICIQIPFGKKLNLNYEYYNESLFEEQLYLN